MSSYDYEQESCVSENTEIINELIKFLQLSNNSILSNNQIQILLSLSCSDIVNLYKKYNSLSNDILLIDDIIKLAVQNNGLVLEHLSYNKFNDHFNFITSENKNYMSANIEKIELSIDINRLSGDLPSIPSLNKVTDLNINAYSFNSMI